MMLPMLIHAHFDAALGDTIMYFPEGVHKIQASVNGEPKMVEVTISPERGEAIAAAFQRDLENRLSNNVRPIFDFDHAGTGAAAALPQRFYYEKGKGLMVDAEWTGAGKRAREDKDYSYFSPTFLLGEDGVPQGLPQRGPLGALVNDPAFEQISRVAASKATPQPETKPKDTTMSDLVKAGILETAEAALPNAADTAKTRVEALKSEASKVEAANKLVADITKERDELQNKLDEVNAANAKAKVAEAVKAGRIAPKDEKAQKYWEEAIKANPDAIEVLASIAVVEAPKEGAVVDASKGQTAPNNTGDPKILVEARKQVKAGTYKTEDEAIEAIAAEKPELYKEYADNLS